MSPKKEKFLGLNVLMKNCILYADWKTRRFNKEEGLLLEFDEPTRRQRAVRKLVFLNCIFLVSVLN